MKKKILISVIIIFLAGGFVMAQEKDSVVTLPTVTVTASSKVASQLNKVFKTTFPDATNARWYRLGKDYLVKFIVEDMNHNALFKKNGYMKYDISYGYEQNLPADLRTRVLNSYADCKITRVANVKGQDRDVWVVNLESLNNYYLVRIEEGEIEQVQMITKTAP